eukprot:TRINITY_DN1537_c0_g1_i1.p1 TRINITY_DN1537_c0_g1~~TRINITY_DN1537_c0_g1_i1.p1  ORF type:complete len:722 (+),score=212.53 TRINITY_DN1537_c0_g1_i1:44-2209(+)
MHGFRLTFHILLCFAALPVASGHAKLAGAHFVLASRACRAYLIATEIHEEEGAAQGKEERPTTKDGGDALTLAEDIDDEDIDDEEGDKGQNANDQDSSEAEEGEGEDGDDEESDSRDDQDDDDDDDDESNSGGSSGDEGEEEKDAEGDDDDDDDDESQSIPPSSAEPAGSLSTAALLSGRTAVSTGLDSDVEEDEDEGRSTHKGKGQRAARHRAKKSSSKHKSKGKSKAKRMAKSKAKRKASGKKSKRGKGGSSKADAGHPTPALDPMLVALLSQQQQRILTQAGAGGPAAAKIPAQVAAATAMAVTATGSAGNAGSAAVPAATPALAESKLQPAAAGAEAAAGKAAGAPEPTPKAAAADTAGEAASAEAAAGKDAKEAAVKDAAAAAPKADAAEPAGDPSSEKDGGKTTPAPKEAAADAKGAPAAPAAGLWQPKQKHDFTIVACNTSVGPLDLDIFRKWAPKGADHFVELVEDGWYDGIAMYRALANFLVQFGNNPDKTKFAKWGDKNIADDPPRNISFKRGTISYAGYENNSRSTEVFIALDENPGLGASPWETPIGQVSKDSLALLDKIFTGYGDGPPDGKGPDTEMLAREGDAYLQKNFPNLTRIYSCKVSVAVNRNETETGGDAKAAAASKPKEAAPAASEAPAAEEPGTTEAPGAATEAAGAAAVAAADPKAASLEETEPAPPASSLLFQGAVHRPSKYHGDYRPPYGDRDALRL